MKTAENINRKNAVVVGGSHGIGLSIVNSLEGYDKIYVLDVSEPEIKIEGKNIEYIQFDLTNADYSYLDGIENVSALIITAGIGHLSLFENETDADIDRIFKINAEGPIKIIRHFYDRLSSTAENFYCAVMVSIAGRIASPFFATYSATKAALRYFIEAVNAELEKGGAHNRILEVSPGSIKGTGFSGGKTSLDLTGPLAKEILDAMYERRTLLIPAYEEVFRKVLARYAEDPRKFALESYDYKLESGRIAKK